MHRIPSPPPCLVNHTYGESQMIQKDLPTSLPHGVKKKNLFFVPFINNWSVEFLNNFTLESFHLLCCTYNIQQFNFLQFQNLMKKSTLMLIVLGWNEIPHFHSDTMIDF